MYFHSSSIWLKGRMFPRSLDSIVLPVPSSTNTSHLYSPTRNFTKLYRKYHRFNCQNQLKNEIERLNIQRMTTRWERATQNTVRSFPKLTIEDLKRITLGSYQLAISGKYIEQHMKEDSHFGIYVHRENDEIIRAKIQSRFSRSKTHDTWVKFDQNKNGFEAINGYYCSCKVGERTLACCSHVASVLRYLGHDRHQPPKHTIQTRNSQNIIISK